MKIIYCLAGTFNSGGMERIVIRKANWLAINGFDVTLVTTEQQGRSHFFPVDSRIRCVDLDINYSDNPYAGSLVVKYRIRRKKQLLHKQRLSEFLKQEQPDITISTYGNEVEFLYKINDGSKKIVEIHFSRWFRLQGEQPNALYCLVNKYLTWRDKWRISRYDAFVCLTHEDRSFWDNLDNVHVITNFLESASVEQAPLMNKQVIAVGRLSYQKGYDRLIRAWSLVHREYNDWKLKIFGGGELHEELLRLISDLDLTEVVQMCNPVKDIYKEYTRSSLFALSSHFEGMPMVLLEAMRCGLPVVSFACKCGPRDLIEDGVNGLLIEEGNIEQLASGLMKLIANPELRKKMGAQAYHASSKYTEAVIMPQWVKLFDTMASA